jgi:DNA-binding response OmpR family regulator
MNVVKILILENNEESALQLTKILYNNGFKDVITVDVADDLDNLLSETKVEFAIIGFSFLEKNGQSVILSRLENANIPFLCLFSNESLTDKNLLIGNQPYALHGHPFNPDSLSKSIENALFFKKKEEYEKLRKRLLMDDHVFVKMGSQLEKINTNQILYISSDGNYSMVQTSNRKYAVKTSLKKMLEDLPTESFARIHRGYLVQMAKVSKINISDNQIYVGEQALPLGRYYKSDVLSRLNKIG